MWKKWERIKQQGTYVEEFFAHEEEQIEWDTIGERVQKIILLFEELQRKETTMTPFIVTYDISNNRLRTHLMKYLLSKGLNRVQRSVYLGKSSGKIFQEMQRTFQEISDALDKNDSIMVVPINQDISERMKFIGKNVDIDISERKRHTLFV